MEAPNGRFGYFNTTNCFRSEAGHSQRYFLDQSAPGSDREQGDRTDMQEFSFGTQKQIMIRPKLSSKTMLMGLVERTENYNKAVDRKILTDSRLALEEEQLRGHMQNKLTEMEELVVSNQHVATKGRGVSFGRLRSTNNGYSPRVTFADTQDDDDDYAVMFRDKARAASLSSLEENNNIKEVLSFQMPRRSEMANRQTRNEDTSTRHHFDPSTAYSGRVVPNYRYSYKPDQNPQMLPFHHGTAPCIPNVAAPIRPGQRYPKRPENNPEPIAKPKTLSHNYYEINLYGKAQEERTAQRIEKTVRQTETPARF